MKPSFSPASALRFLLLPFALLAATAGWAQSGRLEFADRVRMVSCDPSTGKPCFRVAFNVVDAQGLPLNLDLPPAKNLRGMLKIKLENEEIDPFYAVARTGQTKAVRGRVALIVVDISGSMNIKLPSGRTRFQTAQEAMQQFLEGFDESVDHVAIVPFESHNVAEPINNAQFATTKADVSSQIEALPVPQPRNNTALYSAVVLGLQVGVVELQRHVMHGLQGNKVFHPTRMRLFDIEVFEG